MDNWMHAFLIVMFSHDGDGERDDYQDLACCDTKEEAEEKLGFFKTLYSGEDIGIVELSIKMVV